ncbi:hypothetical protein [Candidatus Binatus sp.]|jgi:hypothetical protein|uniref:hypothetical protein n=1 Tax=Candidatus Binatus sp. TaxID=2811406 RepID=UPI003BCFF6BF
MRKQRNHLTQPSAYHRHFLFSGIVCSFHENQNSKKTPNATQYVATLKRGLKNTVSAIGALVSMTTHCCEFRTEVL